ncbi:MAG: efflux RND transporter periplasmic adaptor subunit [Bryobacteraceae bacterium]
MTTSVSCPHARGAWAIIAIAAGVLLTAGCQMENPAAAASNPDRKPRKVQLTAAAEDLVPRGIEVTGTLAARDQVQLAMKVPGRVADLLVDLGDRVRKGQQLARLDPADLELAVRQAVAALQQARSRLGLPPNGKDDRVNVEETPIVRQAAAMLNEAKLNRDRAQQMFEQKLIARADYDTTVATFQVAESRYHESVEEIWNRQAMLAQRRSELQLARQMLSYATLVSPIDGAVLDRQASVGQYLPGGAPVVTVIRIHPLRLRLPVPERAAAGVRVGQKVLVRVDQDPAAYEGQVSRISPAIDQTNRTLLVEAEVPNQQGRLSPGAFVRAEIITVAAEPALFVPASALVTFAGIHKVFTVENGRAVEKTVQTGRKSAKRVEIAEGLKPGDQVVVRPGNLAAGQPVTTAN